MATELNFGDKVIRNVKGYGYLTHYVIYIDAHEGPSSGDWVEGEPIYGLMCPGSPNVTWLNKKQIDRSEESFALDEMTGTTDPEILPEDFFRQTAYWRHPRQDELVPFVRRSIP
jgi:hypothetical protein